MHARSAYIRSFGVTGILVAAALMMLALVSAIVAFDRWPDSTSASRIDSVALDVPVATRAPKPKVIRVRSESRAAARRLRVSRVPGASRSPAPDSAAPGPATQSSPPSVTQAPGPGKPQLAGGPAEPGAPTIEPSAPAPTTPDAGPAVAAVNTTVNAVQNTLTTVLASIAPR